MKGCKNAKSTTKDTYITSSGVMSQQDIIDWDYD